MTTIPEDQATLGELEAEVMGLVWKLGKASVAEVRAALGSRKAAYTTVMTVMTRLHDKGLLRRRKEGRAFIYEPSGEQAEVGGSLLRGLVDKLYAGSSSRAIAHLIENDDEVDDGELARLENLIRRKRRERK